MNKKERLEDLIDPIYKSNQTQIDFQFKGNDLLKQNLMKHVNGIASTNNRNEIVNHLIDLKLLIDTI